MAIEGKVKMIVKACAITALAALVSGSILSTIFSIGASNPSGAVGDFSITDIYNSVVDKKNDHYISDKIKILQTDNCSRLQIAELISRLNSCNVSAIGLDITFPWKNEDDSVLIKVLESCNNLVLPFDAPYDNATDTYSSITGSYFNKGDEENIGIVNIESKSIGSTIKDFKLSYEINGKKFYSMPGKLAKLTYPTCLDYLETKDCETYPINYRSIQFEIIDPSELYDNLNVIKPYLDDQIVMIGAINDGHDQYNTPIDNAMSGVMIHAYATQTILDRAYLKKSSSTTNWLIAIFACYIFIIISIIAKNKLPNSGNLLIRLIQIFCLYVFYLIGCFVFERFYFIIDFMPALSMIALGLVAFDIWEGLIAFKDRLLYLFNKKDKK